MPPLITNIQGYSIHDGPGIRTVVFLKGCGLECRWCSNPECISPKPEIGFIRSLCTGCGKCIQACPEQALRGETGQLPELDRERCTGCGECASTCCYKALILYGKEMSVKEVFEAVRRDNMFYQASGGGITISGGEVLLQPRFVSSLLDACRKQGIHTCIETSGWGPEPALNEVLRYTDLVLYDLKLQDSNLHLKYTGQPNTLVLSNAKIVAASGVDFLFRMPLIPGINDDMENIQATAAFLHTLGDGALRIELMPYHRLGKGKYESLGRLYCLTELSAPDSDRIREVEETFSKLGIHCTVSQ